MTTPVIEVRPSNATPPTSSKPRVRATVSAMVSSLTLCSVLHGVQ
jgi:hypothetical protein